MPQSDFMMQYQEFGSDRSVFYNLRERTLEQASDATIEGWTHSTDFESDVRRIAPNLRSISENITHLGGVVAPEGLQQEYDFLRDSALCEMSVTARASRLLLLYLSDVDSPEAERKMRDFRKLREHGIQLPMSVTPVRSVFVNSPEGPLEYYWDFQSDRVFYAYTDHPEMYLSIVTDDVQLIREADMYSRIEHVRETHRNIASTVPFSEKLISQYSHRVFLNDDQVYFQAGPELIDVDICKVATGAEVSAGILHLARITYRTMDASHAVAFELDDDIEHPSVLANAQWNVRPSHISTYEDLVLTQDSVSLDTNNDNLISADRLVVLAHASLENLSR